GQRPGLGAQLVEGDALHRGRGVVVRPEPARVQGGVGRRVRVVARGVVVRRAVSRAVVVRGVSGVGVGRRGRLLRAGGGVARGALRWSLRAGLRGRRGRWVGVERGERAVVGGGGAGARRFVVGGGGRRRGPLQHVLGAEALEGRGQAPELGRERGRRRGVGEGRRGAADEGRRWTRGAEPVEQRLVEGDVEGVAGGELVAQVLCEATDGGEIVVTVPRQAGVEGLAGRRGAGAEQITEPHGAAP